VKPEPADRLIVAVDVGGLSEAVALLDSLVGVVGMCKIGSQLFAAAGPGAVEAARKRGFKVFLDLKFHDIPSTVASAVRGATRLGVFMLNVHASGGLAMMRAAAEAAAGAASEVGDTRPICLGVTVLTSLDARALEREVGARRGLAEHVLHLATLAREAGLDGCVASPQEVRPLRDALGPGWVIVSPGIRPATTADDQARVATPAAAVRAGADYVVVGRPITQAPDARVAARAILEELRRS
jgi:orotidine-5'-phosphate decarboxylase